VVISPLPYTSSWHDVYLIKHRGDLILHYFKNCTKCDNERDLNMENLGAVLGFANFDSIAMRHIKEARNINIKLSIWHIEI
jgi:hypothetical protein